MLNGSILVTIGVPIYRVEKFIDRCVVSLFNQTYDNIEYIFVDDCSDDSSIDVLNSVIDRFPERKKQVRIIRNLENKGLGYTRNLIVKEAKGIFVLHVDSDDWIEEDTVEKCVKKQQETNSDIVVFNFIVHANNGICKKRIKKSKTVEERTCSLLKRESLPCLWILFIRRSLYIDYNIQVSNGVNNSEDYNVSPILSYYAKKIVYLDDYLYHYNELNNNAYSHSYSKEKEEQVWCTINKLNVFFRDKGVKYVDSLTYGTAFFIVESIIACVKVKNFDRGKSLFEKLENYAPSIINELPLKLRIIAYIRCCRLLYLFLWGKSLFKRL